MPAMSMRLGESGVPIERIEVSAYTVPTDAPESDGTYEWEHTTLVLVEVTRRRADGPGLFLRRHGDRDAWSATCWPSVIQGRDAMAVPAAWSAMVAAIRNLGRPGIASMAISAVDAALWDLKGRLLDLPAGHAPGRGPRGGAGLRQRRVHVVFARAAPRPAWRLGRRRASRGSR